MHGVLVERLMEEGITHGSSWQRNLFLEPKAIIGN
jgi:hypothetical protein